MYYVCVYKIKISVEMYAYFYFHAINHEHVAMKNKTHIILYHHFKGLRSIPSQSQLVSL